MKVKSAAASATAAIVPGTVIVGVALVVQTIVGLSAENDHLRAQVRARPTVTATPTLPPPQPTPTPQPTPEPGAGVGRAVGVLVAAQRLAGQAGGMEVDPGGGSDHPPTSPPVQECPRGQVLTLNLPLGLLPCDSLVIGGRQPQPTEGQ